MSPPSLPGNQMAPSSFAAVLQNIAVPQAIVGHPMVLPAQQAAPNLTHALDSRDMRMTRRPGSESFKAEALEPRNGDERKEEKTQEEDEPIRCHFHRKPQLNCKICRRVYYSAASDKKADEETPGVRMRGAEAFEITNKQTYNFNSMLRDQILKNTYFKTLVKIDTFEGIMDDAFLQSLLFSWSKLNLLQNHLSKCSWPTQTTEMYQYVETAETYGGGSTTVPSSLFCCLYRLFTIGLSYDELSLLCESKDWPYIRCCGFLYIRFGSDARTVERV
eukprot:g27610.t1